MFLACTLTSDGPQNLGGGGGGGMVLSRGGGIPLDDGWTNFLGAGIVDIFLTTGPSDCSLVFRGCNLCNWVRVGENKNPNTTFESDTSLIVSTCQTTKSN